MNRQGWGMKIKIFELPPPKITSYHIWIYHKEFRFVQENDQKATGSDPTSSAMDSICLRTCCKDRTMSELDLCWRSGSSCWKQQNGYKAWITWLTCHMTQLAAISYQTHPADLHLDSDWHSSNHYTHQHPIWINMTHFTFRCRFVSSTTLLIFISRSLKIFKSTSNSNTRFLFSWKHPWAFPGSKQQHRWLNRVNHANQGGI